MLCLICQAVEVPDDHLSCVPCLAGDPPPVPLEAVLVDPDAAIAEVRRWRAEVGV